jgi:hypothetical protein
MPTVTINAVDYDVYADVDAANEFLAADFGATLWRAEADEDQKARALVSSTRLLNRLNWAGDKTDVDQSLAWPRTGFSDVDEDTIPQGVVDASIVLAKLIHAGSSVDSSGDQASNIKRLKAGSVEQEFFSPTIFAETGRLPLEVEELIGRYLAGFGLSATFTSGTCGESIADVGFSPGWNF